MSDPTDIDADLALVPDTETDPRPPIESDQILNNPQPHMGGEIEQKRKRGRPPGSKNKTTLLQAAIRDDFTRLAKRRSRAIFDKLTECAKAGEPWAVKIFMDKIMPNASDEEQVKKGDFGITINITDMRNDEKVIDAES